MNLYKSDKVRGGANPPYQKLFRNLTDGSHSKNWGGKIMYLMYKFWCRIYCVEIPLSVKIGKGLYIGHPYAITISGAAVIGENCNISKGVTIGSENRGRRKGAPTIGNKVWIGVNSTVVGNIVIGDDVLIAPNSYVNVDVPSHSIVLGNPCVIKHCDHATEGYICCTV